MVPKKNIAGLFRTKEPEESRLFKHRLDKNERTIAFDSKFMLYLKEKLTDEIIMAYPEVEPLYKLFSKWLGISRDCLLFNMGSDLSIKAVFETYINKGDKILIHKPGYAMCDVYAKMFGAKTRVLEYDSELNFDLEKYIDMIDRNLKMVVLESPNGFAGNVYPMEKILELVRKAKKNGMIALIDEAYYFFHNESIIKHLKEFDNLIIVRTFSKAFGAAGLRAGYTISQKKNIDNLFRVKPMHEMNSISVYMITELLKNDKIVRHYWEENKKNLEYLKKSFKKMGIKVTDSKANFVTAKIGDKIDCSYFIKEMKKHKFLISGKEENLSKWVRIGTTTLELEKEFINKAKVIIQSKGGVKA